MSVKKLSVSLPSEVADAAARAADVEGITMSAWLSVAVQRRLEHERALDVGYQAALEAVAMTEAMHGPITAADREWTNAALIAMGLEPEPPIEDHPRGDPA